MKPLNRRQTLHKLLGASSARKRVEGWQCARCGHHWAARMHKYRLKRGGRPVACPRCKRRNWWIEDGILQKSRRTV